ncbi:hypothetical protein CTAYLR_004166 [Chrysophaeum taylorii]|uniref:ribose-phosphate diphosphokinase n=1 Tax=Chrysophaeum taylorii TaxID=2483200 RepID=A0AAD7ULQ4_9STRA|nr:hypothetical protein CTAYLR_004166 [Chrysophaeum taylorii]
MEEVGKKDLSKLKLVTGTSNRALADEISARLGVSLSPAYVKRFNDGEVNIRLSESVRGCDVFILQSCGPPVNDNLVELLLLISSAKRASAASVTAVVPYYPYARQSHLPDKLRVPIAGADVAKMMESMGVDRVLSIDLHCAQIQGFFGPRTPVDNLYAAPAAVSYFHSKDLVRPAVVSPDAAGVARAKLFCEGLQCSADIPHLAICVKVGDTVTLVGDVDACDVIVVDDLIDSGRTLTTAANHCKDKGAKRIFGFATHALFSGTAGELIEASAVDEIIVANTIELAPKLLESTRKVRQLSVGKLIEGAVRAIHTGDSVSELFTSTLAGSSVLQ